MNQAAKTPTSHGYSSSQTISSFDSELWDAMTLENTAPGRAYRVNRVGELRKSACP